MCTLKVARVTTWLSVKKFTAMIFPLPLSDSQPKRIGSTAPADVELATRSLAVYGVASFGRVKLARGARNTGHLHMWHSMQRARAAG